MKILIYKQEEDTNIKEIQKAERLYGKLFPDEFKEHLLKYNGGTPYPRFPSLETESNSELTDVYMFCSVGDVIV